jgi:hypothetical protein
MHCRLVGHGFVRDFRETCALDVREIGLVEHSLVVPLGAGLLGLDSDRCEYRRPGVDAS